MRDPQSTHRIRVGSVWPPQLHVWDPYGIHVGSDIRPLGSSSVPKRFLVGSAMRPLGSSSVPHRFLVGSTRRSSPRSSRRHRAPGPGQGAEAALPDRGAPQGRAGAEVSMRPGQRSGGEALQEERRKCSETSALSKPSFRAYLITLPTVPRTAYRVPRTADCGLCTLWTVCCVPRTEYCVLCTVYRVPRTEYRVLCTVLCTVYRVPRTVYCVL